MLYAVVCRTACKNPEAPVSQKQMTCVCEHAWPIKLFLIVII